MNYPHGVADQFEYCLIPQNGAAEWTIETLEGSWFPHGFVGTMSSLQRYLEGSEGVVFACTHAMWSNS